MHKALIAALFLFILTPDIALAAAKDKKDKNAAVCDAMDRPCLLRQMEQLAPEIETANWRDQTYRELAKTYTYEGQPDKAIALIDKIENNDTKAMTVRGIGMAMASSKYSKTQSNVIFGKLADKAKEINHAPSQAIAYTYIAMSQAFMGDDEAARATAAGMTNAALRNKAYGETAEIDAERGDLKNALLALARIDTQSYRNKAYDTVSRIFLEKALIVEAYDCASRIENTYLKAKAIQRILNKGNTEEEDMEPKTDVMKELE